MSFLKNVVKAFTSKTEKSKAPTSPSVLSWSNITCTGFKKALVSIEENLPKKFKFDDSLIYDVNRIRLELSEYEKDIRDLAEAIINNRPQENIDPEETYESLPATIIYILTSYCPIIPRISSPTPNLKDPIDGELPPLNRDALDCLMKHLSKFLSNKNTKLTPQILFEQVGTALFSNLEGSRNIDLKKSKFLSLLNENQLQQSSQQPSKQQPQQQQSSQGNIGNSIQDRSIKITFADLENRPDEHQLKTILSQFGNIANIGFKDRIAVVLFSDWSEALTCAQEVQNIDMGMDLKVKYLGSHKWPELAAIQQEQRQDSVSVTQDAALRDASSQPDVIELKEKEKDRSRAQSLSSETHQSFPSEKSDGESRSAGGGAAEGRGGWLEAKKISSPDTKAEVRPDGTNFRRAPSDEVHVFEGDDKIEVSSIPSEGDDLSSKNPSIPATQTSQFKIESSTSSKGIAYIPEVNEGQQEADQLKKKKIFFDYNDDDSHDEKENIDSPSSKSSNNNQIKSSTGLDRQLPLAVFSSSPNNPSGREMRLENRKPSWKTAQPSSTSPGFLTLDITSSAEKLSTKNRGSPLSSQDIVRAQSFRSSSSEEQQQNPLQSIGPSKATVPSDGSSDESADRNKASKISPAKGEIVVTKISPSKNRTIDSLSENEKNPKSRQSSEEGKSNESKVKEREDKFHRDDEYSKSSSDQEAVNLSSSDSDSRKRRKKKERKLKQPRRASRSNKDSARKADKPKKKTHESFDSQSQATEESVSHHHSEHFALPNLWTNQDDAVKLSEKLKKIDFESQNREAQLHQLQLQDMQRCEESWATEIVKLSLRNTALMEENSSLRDALRRLKIELSTATAALMAAEAAKSSLEVQLKALRDRANREALSTVLTQNKMIASLESRLKDSEVRFFTMESEISHMKTLHDKAVENAVYWKAKALAQAIESVENPAHQNKTTQAGNEDIPSGESLNELKFARQQEIFNNHEKNGDGEVNLIEGSESYSKIHEQTDENEAYASLNSLASLDLPTLKKATQQEIQEYVNSLPEEPYKRASLTLQQDVVSSFSRRTLQRRAEGEGIQLSQSALPLEPSSIVRPSTTFKMVSNIANSNYGDESKEFYVESVDSFGDLPIPDRENSPPPFLNNLVTSLDSFKPPQYRSLPTTARDTPLIVTKPKSQKSTALIRLAVAHSQGILSADSVSRNMKPALRKASSEDIQFPLRGDPTDNGARTETVPAGDSPMLYYSHLFPSQSTQFEERFLPKPQATVTDSNGRGQIPSKKAVPARSKELQAWYTERYE